MTYGVRLKRTITLGALSVLGMLLWLPVPAAATSQLERSYYPLPGAITAPPPGVSIEDKVFRNVPEPLQRATASAAEQVYYTPDGARVFITTSDGYTPDPAIDQAWANFFGSLLHNFELDGLRVFIATPQEMPTLCGGDTIACYTPSDGQLVIVGQASYLDVPTDYAAAHEYGHHIENHRRNPPWLALDFGTKGWASYERICPGRLSGRYTAPDDRGYDYFRDPSEAFAEAYAYYHQPGRQVWDWPNSLLPDPEAFDQIEFDVQQPWTGPQRQSRRGRVSRRSDRADTLHFKTPLDGVLDLYLKGPGRSDLDLHLTSGGKGHVLKKSVRRGSREHIRFIVCGGYKFDAHVTAYRGAGRYRLRILRP